MKILKYIITFFKYLLGFKSLRDEKPVKTVSASKVMKEHMDTKRASMSDHQLLLNYTIIKEQVKRGYRGDKTLVEYVNELEYRGLKYE